jgi:Lrp/AsnC family transcriptional regulator for asnA, asnC and gidA
MSTAHRPSPRGLPVDAISRSIVEQLRADGRRSYAEIGKAVGLSEAAVRQRVQKLTDAGVIRIVALTDPHQLGLTRQAMIGVTVSGDVRLVADALAAIPAVDYVVITAGTFDLLAEVVCEDDDELVELLNARIRALEGVVTTETFVYLKVHTQDGHGRSR